MNEFILDEKVHPKPEFIVVAGDNYYPLKKKNKATGEKIKTVDLAELKSGFECLPSTIKKYVLLGNHDLEYFPENKNGKNVRF